MDAVTWNMGVMITTQNAVVELEKTTDLDQY